MAGEDFGSYILTATQFSWFHDKLFTLCQAIMPRGSNGQDEDILSMTGLVVILIKSAIELIQGVSLALSMRHIFRCYDGEVFGCVVHAVTFPIDLLGSSVYYWVSGILTGVLYICMIAAFGWLAYNQRQKISDSTSKESYLVYLFPIFGVLYVTNFLG